MVTVVGVPTGAGKRVAGAQRRPVVTALVSQDGPPVAGLAPPKTSVRFPLGAAMMDPFGREDGDGLGPMWSTRNRSG